MLRRLTAIVDPVACPCTGVPQGLQFGVEIVQRMECVGGGRRVGGIAPLEQEVGRKPAVRKLVRGGGNQIPVVMVVMVIIFHRWNASDACMAFGPDKSKNFENGSETDRVGKTNDAHLEMVRSSRERNGSARMLYKQRAGEPALELRYCGVIFDACRPLGPRLVS